MQDIQDPVAVTQLSLPKGGGNLQGMGESLGTPGPDGVAQMSLPLPVSAGRGMSPALSLSYSSASGNGPFGLGWQVGVMSIRRRTSRGVPTYNDHDAFIGPGNEELVRELDDHGQPLVRETDTAQGVALAQRWRVTRFRSRTGAGTPHMEYWQPTAAGAFPFWLCHTPDGQVHCLGQRADARLACPDNPAQIAEWHLQESVSPSGEHISYHYAAENDAGTRAAERESHPRTAQLYLQQVRYGNRPPLAHLFAWDTTAPAPDAWLFTLVLDYGERPASLNKVPALQTDGEWGLRADPFSRYDYGFEVRTRRLCHQVLMFHDVAALEGSASAPPVLVSRLLLTYHASPSVTQLTGCRLLAHEPDGSLCARPPLSLGYQTFEPQHAPAWRMLTGLQGFNDGLRYQWVDLYNEGVPGILYQDEQGWQYRAPERTPGTTEGITYGSPRLLPAPSLMQGGRLMDLTGDGRLDWLVARPGLAGFYRRHPDKGWGDFTPLAALPTEFWQAGMHFADLNGNGLSDVALIGPKSVRLYPGTREGFAAGSDVDQIAGITLPVSGVDERELVAFCDLPGSGQMHLVRVRHNSVTCWPNLGHGRFGTPYTVLGFSQPESEFDPGRLFLADLDGSGTTDLIYAHTDHLWVYINQSGNHFDKPLVLPLPDGVRYDHTCQLTVGDLQGQGVSSLVLSRPHMSEQHWRYDLAGHKPYLLNQMNNNCGAENRLHYRSSGQFWLDEKAAAGDVGDLPVNHLPFPVHLLAATESRDEITGNRLVQTATYRHGVWDGREREFRGFALVETLDTDERAQGNAEERSAPVLTRQWFHTGLAGDESRYRQAYWAGDHQAAKLGSTRITRFDGDKEVELGTPEAELQYWLHRALRGSPLRTEVYAADGSDRARVPYQVTQARYQVRVIQPAAASVPYPVVAPLPLEQWSYHYERVAEDPLVSQDVTLVTDKLGYPLRTVSVNYPRRARPLTSPYRLDLPEGAWEASYDEQQDVLRLTEIERSYHHLETGNGWRTGLLHQQRVNLVTKPGSGSTLPLSAEDLLQETGPLGTNAPRQYAGHTTVHYTAGRADSPLSTPTVQALVAYQESAKLDSDSLKALDGILNTPEQHVLLQEAGYTQTLPAFARPDETKVWVAARALTDYGSAAQFFRPLTQRASTLTGNTTLTWDRHHCVVTATEDAAGHRNRAIYDYRFMVPVLLTDINANDSMVTFDALGRVTSSRIRGTEDGLPAGCPTPEAVPFRVPATPDDALALSGPLPVSQFMVYADDAWARRVPNDVDPSLRQALHEPGLMTEDGYLCALAYARALKRPGLSVLMSALDTDSDRVPPHVLTVVTDRYYPDKEQQQRQQVVFFDGAGRELQTVQRVPPGEACQRLDDGSLAVNDDALPQKAHSEARWAITGRTEYDNKGLPVRRYQPFFINSWRWLRDDSARENTWADTHSYDALGRETHVLTAAGWHRRTQYTPWFVVSEDENDLAHLS